jgi:predicted ATPase
MTFEATVPFSESLKEAYGRAGYVFEIVQRGSISDRAASVRAAVEQHLSTI